MKRVINQAERDALARRRGFDRFTAKAVFDDVVAEAQQYLG